MCDLVKHKSINIVIGRTFARFINKFDYVASLQMQGINAWLPRL